MPKFFCISDIHGYYDEMIYALNNAGFDRNDTNHWLIVCGDCFDRGYKNVDVYNFLTSLDRKIIIKGNHESLLMECVTRGYPLRHDISNGTAQTILDFGDSNEFKKACKTTGKLLGEFIESMPYYFETKNYVFVHGWLPPMLGEYNSVICVIHPQWQQATSEEWEKGMWRNGMAMFFRKETIEKTVVCGHWHASYGHCVKGHCPDEFGNRACFDPYIEDGIMAIDGCTAHTGKCNVVVIEDDFHDDFIAKGDMIYESKE